MFICYAEFCETNYTCAVGKGYYKKLEEAVGAAYLSAQEIIDGEKKDNKYSISPLWDLEGDEGFGFTLTNTTTDKEECHYYFLKAMEETEE